jgi:hypothetical protein
VKLAGDFRQVVRIALNIDRYTNFSGFAQNQTLIWQRLRAWSQRNASGAGKSRVKTRTISSAAPAQLIIIIKFN